MFDNSTIAQKINAIDESIAFQDSIEYILTDSRSLTHSEHTLFFAITTATGDGHLYIHQLYERGVRNFVVTLRLEEYEDLKGKANFFQVRDALTALQRLAAEWRNEFQIPVIGITGSNGKTVVKEFLYQLLSPYYRVVRSPKSYNSQLGVPLSVLKMSSDDQLAIFEAGISQPGEMLRLADIISPTIGIFTNIGSAHQEYFDDLAHKINQKLLLFRSCEHIIYNADDERIRKGIEESGLYSRSVGWSMKNRDASIFVEIVSRSSSSTTLSLHYIGLSQTIEIPFTDEASIENCIHCFAVICVLLPRQVTQVKDLFRRLEPVEMRLEVKEGMHGNYIINDTYNNDINSLRIALEYQSKRAQADGHKRVLILSDILQSAVVPKTLYVEVAKMIKEFGCDLLIGVGKSIYDNRDYFRKINSSFFLTTKDLLYYEPYASLKDCSILIKGAREFGFEAVVEKLSRQVHETVLEVDIESIAKNFKLYKSKLPPSTRFIVMAKAQGYGVGAYELAKTLEQQQVEAIAVAVADEGKELRMRGILTPIIVMNPEISAFDLIIRNGMEPELYSLSMLERFMRHVEKAGFDRYPVHIEIDTGMHRLGFLPQEIDLLADTLKHLPLLHVKSVYTHLAAADDPKEDVFTIGQLETFKKAANLLEEKLGYPLLRHALNTAGIERFPQYHFDMVRLGLGIYGISPTGISGLSPVSKLRTTLLQIKEIPEGESIGYGRRGMLSGTGKIGIIPIGYADGFDRRFSRGVGKVSVKGKLCPIVGNVCMDTCMIDLTGVPANEGDEVIVFGAPGVLITDLADAVGTIPYEIISKLSPRVRRAYYKE